MATRDDIRMRLPPNGGRKPFDVRLQDLACLTGSIIDIIDGSPAPAAPNNSLKRTVTSIDTSKLTSDPSQNSVVR